MKKILLLLYFVIFSALLICNAKAGTYVAKYNKMLSPSEKEAICQQLENAAKPPVTEHDGLGGGIIPDEVLINLYNATRSISNSISLVSSLGDSLMCHAVHTDKQRLPILGITLVEYPNIPVWICGAIIYFFGFMFLLSITFYVVDISFKLGFAIILMPIGVALWPFEKTKDKIVILISIFLKSAAILAFLSITVAYTVNMLSKALVNLKDIFEAIGQNDTDYIQEAFSLDAGTFLLIVAALAYGMKLIGSTIPDYVNKFFPDKAFGGASPMHHLSTQAMDFAKKKVVAPVATYVGNVAETQVGKGVVAVGKFVRGDYHQDIVKNIGRAVRNPRQTLKKAQLAVAHGETKVVTGAMKGLNNLKYGAKIAASNLVAGKQNRQDLKEKLREERDEKNQYIDDTVAANYDNAKKSIDDTIAQREQDRADDKQRKHEEKMDNDPAYRERFLKKQAKAENKKNRKETRFSKIARGILRMPGTILEKTGEAMQDHKKR